MRITTEGPIPKMETCDFQLTETCRHRNGATITKQGYALFVDGKTKFACDECAATLTKSASKPTLSESRSMTTGLAER